MTTILELDEWNRYELNNKELAPIADDLQETIRKVMLSIPDDKIDEACHIFMTTINLRMAKAINAIAHGAKAENIPNLTTKEKEHVKDIIEEMQDFNHVMKVARQKGPELSPDAISAMKAREQEGQEELAENKKKYESSKVS